MADPDEEDDYMSDMFLQNAPAAPKVDPRQQLPSWKRRAKLAAAPVPAKRTKASVKEDIREGLAQPLQAGNKGFQMLLKMGFKEGQGLGEEGKGKKEPVGVEIKEGRRGLGWELAVQQQQKARTQVCGGWRRSTQ